MHLISYLLDRGSTLTASASFLTSYNLFFPFSKHISAVYLKNVLFVYKTVNENVCFDFIIIIVISCEKLVFLLNERNKIFKKNNGNVSCEKLKQLNRLTTLIYL